jgi:phenylacetic acid degradation operon negative regulatory protein
MLQSLFVANKTRIEPIGGEARETQLQPLTPRSIVLSVLLGSHPPQMSVRRILEFTSLFDLADGTVRTALSRMVAAGDLVNDDGTYRLAGRLVERQAQQDVGRHHPPDEWDGTWWTVAVHSDRRSMADRRSFRARAIGARLGELRPDLWLRPANIDITTDLPDALITRGQIVAGDQRALVAQLWRLDDLRSRADAQTSSLAAAARELDTADDRALANAFVALASAQQFLRVEPQLPDELAPTVAATELRETYAAVLDVFQAQLTAFFADRRNERVSTAGK